MRKIRLGSAVWGVLIGAGIALALAACAKGQSPVSAAGEPASSGAETMESPVDDKKQEIRGLLDKITEWRLEHGLPREPSAVLIQNVREVPLKQLRVCVDDPDPITDTCKDVCSLKEA